MKPTYQELLVKHLRCLDRVSKNSRKKARARDEAIALGAPIGKPISLMMSPRAKKPRVVIIRNNFPGKKSVTIFRPKAVSRYEVVDYKPSKKKKSNAKIA